jgi:hypothetical protein
VVGGKWNRSLNCYKDCKFVLPILRILLSVDFLYLIVLEWFYL